MTTSPLAFARFETSPLTRYARPSAATANQDSQGRSRRHRRSGTRGHLSRQLHHFSELESPGLDKPPLLRKLREGRRFGAAS